MDMNSKNNRNLLCITLFLATILLSSCGANWHLRRAIKIDPSILQQKTITVTDTVVTEPTAVLDTVTISKVDTIEIVKNNFRVKIMRSYDTLIIDGGCESDTIVRTVEVPIEKIVYHEREKWYHKLYKWSFFLLLFGLGAEGLRRIFRFS